MNFIWALSSKITLAYRYQCSILESECHTEHSQRFWNRVCKIIQLLFFPWIKSNFDSILGFLARKLSGVISCSDFLDKMVTVVGTIFEVFIFQISILSEFLVFLNSLFSLKQHWPRTPRGHPRTSTLLRPGRSPGEFSRLSCARDQTRTLTFKSNFWRFRAPGRRRSERPYRVPRLLADLWAHRKSTIYRFFEFASRVFDAWTTLADLQKIRVGADRSRVGRAGLRTSCEECRGEVTNCSCDQDLRCAVKNNIFCDKISQMRFPDIPPELSIEGWMKSTELYQTLWVRILGSGKSWDGTHWSLGCPFWAESPLRINFFTTVFDLCFRFVINKSREILGPVSQKIRVISSTGR